MTTDKIIIPVTIWLIYIYIDTDIVTNRTPAVLLKGYKHWDNTLNFSYVWFLTMWQHDTLQLLYIILIQNLLKWHTANSTQHGLWGLTKKKLTALYMRPCCKRESFFFFLAMCTTNHVKRQPLLINLPFILFTQLQAHGIGNHGRQKKCCGF